VCDSGGSTTEVVDGVGALPDTAAATAPVAGAFGSSSTLADVTTALAGSAALLLLDAVEADAAAAEAMAAVKPAVDSAAALVVSGTAGDEGGPRPSAPTAPPSAAPVPLAAPVVLKGDAEPEDGATRATTARVNEAKLVR
jgi:hypothetical protein